MKDQAATWDSAIFGESEPEANDQTSRQTFSLADSIGGCQQGESLQQSHLLVTRLVFGPISNPEPPADSEFLSLLRISDFFRFL